MTKGLFSTDGEKESRIAVLRRLPLTALQAFEAAGRTGSFARAAEELDLSPSAISHAIRKLESAAGIRLFERSTREVALTAKGKTLLEHVQRGLDEIAHGLSLVTVSGSKKTPLRLHTAPSFGTQWLIPRLARFRIDHPHIDLRFSSSTDYATFEDDFDLDVVYGEPAPSPHEKIPLVIEELTPLCAPQLASAIRSAHDLYAQPLIQSDGQTVKWKGWFDANGLRPPKQYGLGFDRSSMVISAAVDGLGIALESSLLAEREIASGKLVAPLRGLGNSVRYIGHYLVHPRWQRQNQASSQFKRWLMEELGLQATSSTEGSQ